MPPVDDGTPAQLTDELKAAHRFYRARAYLNYAAAYLVYAGILATSVVGTISVAADLLPRGALVAVTALPGVLLVAAQSLRLHAKYRWHQRQSWAVTNLLLRLKFEGATVAQVSKMFRQLRVRSERNYPALRLTPSLPKQKTRD
jgi:hypothetical protein